MDDDDRVPWDRQDGEPNFWYQRFELYRLAGPTRELLATVRQEKENRGVQRSTRSIPGAWWTAHKSWKWQARAEAWDEHCSNRAAAEAEAERMAILRSGFAQRHERVRALDGITRLLLDELHETDKRWLPDVKQIGSGENAEKVELVRFNAGLVHELRGLLDDLAAEMGERVKKREMSGPEGGPIPVTIREVVHELPADDRADDLEG